MMADLNKKAAGLSLFGTPQLFNNQWFPPQGL
jgi:hypothetical protein